MIKKPKGSIWTNLSVTCLAEHSGWVKGLTQCFQYTVSTSLTLMTTRHLSKNIFMFLQDSNTYFSSLFPSPKASEKWYAIVFPISSHSERQPTKPSREKNQQSTPHKHKPEISKALTGLNKGNFNMTIFTAFSMRWAPNISIPTLHRGDILQISATREIHTLFLGASSPHRDTHFPLPRDTGLPPSRTLLLVFLPDPCKLNHLGVVQRLFPGQLAKQTNTSYKKLKSGLIKAAPSTRRDDSDIYESMQ